uniref:Uncharacterized protein n=1 Tax=Anopheles melas TaxID=34690 RepID=A0A182U6F9_9DIPT
MVVPLSPAGSTVGDRVSGLPSTPFVPSSDGSSVMGSEIGPELCVEDAKLCVFFRHGLLPMPIEDISASRISRFRLACFHSSLEISSVHAFFTSSLIVCSVQVSPGLRLRNQISNR